MCRLKQLLTAMRPARASRVAVDAARITMKPSASYLLNIPEDVCIRIFLALDFASLSRCKRLCRGIRDLINNTVEIEYKLALARAGKIELGRNRLCIADRLRALEALYTTVPPLDAIPFIQLPDEIIPHWPGVTDGFIPYLTNNRLDLTLWRPISPIRGVREERRSIPAIMSHLSDSLKVPPAKMVALAVDVAQDLFVFSRPARPEISPSECYMYSISEGGPHPAAGPNPFRIAFGPVVPENGFYTIEDLQIFGDVVAWSLTDDTHSAMHVWNWKTSVLVWHHQSGARGSSCRVISPVHVALITTQSVSVYKFDPSAERMPQPASLATALYVLELPRLNASRFAPFIRTYMQFPPSAPARPDHHGSDGQAVAFGLDPAQTVLVVTLLQSTDIDPEFRLDLEDRYVSERFAIFVPLPTLVARINEAESVGRAGTPIMSGTPRRRRTVPWAQWGPGGTRVVRFQYISHISVMGSRCAFMLSDHNTGTLHSVLFDVRRGALGDETARARLENLSHDLFDVREVLAENLSFAEEVKTTFPIEVTHKTHQDHWSGFLLQDGVAISRHARVTHPALGYQGYDPVGWL